MGPPVQELVEQGRALLRLGDAAGARQVLQQAPAESPCGDVVESLARAAYLNFDFHRAIEEWERAYALHREAGDQLGAIRVARRSATCTPPCWATGPYRGGGRPGPRRC